MPLSPTVVQWRGLTLATGGTDFRVTDLSGWDELPPERVDKASRVNGHGSHPSAVWSDERVVTVMGYCWSATARDALLAQLGRSTAYGSGEGGETLTVTVAGRTLTATAQLLAARPALIRGEWGVGRFGWALRWRCPDPLRYGTTDSPSTPLPLSGGGLDYPLSYPLPYGSGGVSGRVTVRNPGTAPASVLLAIRGALPEGWVISSGARRIASPVPLPSGVTWTIDTGTGEVLVEASASRRGSVTAADWFTVPAADRVTGEPGQLDIQLTSLGGARDPNALLTATVTAAYW